MVINVQAICVASSGLNRWSPGNAPSELPPWGSTLAPVDTRLQVAGLNRQVVQALSHGIVADRRPLGCRLIAVLGDRDC